MLTYYNDFHETSSKNALDWHSETYSSELVLFCQALAKSIKMGISLFKSKLK